MLWKDYKSLIIDILDKLYINDDILKLLKESKTNNQKIFIAGNGGSAATAAHYACDFALGVSRKNFLQNFSRMNVIPLTTNMPLILALANDFGYDQIFKQQLVNLCHKNDIFIAISGSGNSKNIIEAVKYAKKRALKIIGICGYDGGELKKISDFYIHVECNTMEACEDIHSIIGHFITIWLRDQEKSS